MPWQDLQHMANDNIRCQGWQLKKLKSNWNEETNKKKNEKYNIDNNCASLVLTYVTVCYQTASYVGVDFRHFHIIRESLKGMRINFICNTRICIINNF